MKRQVKKWILRLFATATLIVILLVIIVLNPILLYANKSTHKNFTIYHNKTLDYSLNTKLDQAYELLKQSEFFDSSFKLDICLNDDSKYPTTINKIKGDGFAYGFYNKVVMQGLMNCKENIVQLNGYKWNLTQLLAHEMTHCFQFNKLGFWKSKPIANIPNWKWEGYAEYVARQNASQKDLFKNLERLQKTNINKWAITFEDSTIAPKEYYNAWVLVQYCIDIKQMSYLQLLNNNLSEIELNYEMKNWYEAKKKTIKNAFEQLSKTE